LGTSQENTMTNSDLDQTCVNTIRLLADDLVRTTRSEPRGLFAGVEPLAYVLWTRFLRHNPKHPLWCDRDRFVLCPHHGSALVDSLLYLTGYDVAVDRSKRTAPWANTARGASATSFTRIQAVPIAAPGQRIANALGMALGEAHLASRYNRPGYELFRHFTYVLASERDMQEGIQSESSSLAAHLGLARLIVLFDYSEDSRLDDPPNTKAKDVAVRHRAYGWHVVELDNAEDTESVAIAIQAAKDVEDRPSLIAVKSTRANFVADRPSATDSKQNLFDAEATVHNAPWSERDKYGFSMPEAPPFTLSTEALAHFRNAVDRGGAIEAQWLNLFHQYERAFPALASELQQRFAGALSAR
jgi:transketolase